jgi:hypothetical protein
VIKPNSPAAHRLLHRAHASGGRVAVIYVGADAQAHYREGQAAGLDGSRLVLAYQDPAGTPRRTSFDPANPDDVLAVRPAR